MTEDSVCCFVGTDSVDETDCFIDTNNTVGDLYMFSSAEIVAKDTRLSTSVELTLLTSSQQDVSSFGVAGLSEAGACEIYC